MNVKTTKIFYIIIFLFILYSCKKELNNSGSKSSVSTSNNSIIDSFKTGFLNKSYDKRLNQTINDTIILKWVPDWKSYTSSSLGDSLTYYYIALNPVALNTKSNSIINNTEEVNIKKFLLVGKSSSRTFFRIATYFFDETDKKNTENPVKAIGQNYNLNNFTGSILFENLDKNSYSKNYYINGSKIINAKSPVSTNSVLKPNYVVTECQTTAICTYFTNCNGYYVTAVSGVDFCPGEPIFIPSGCFSFNGWQYAGTEYRTSCHDVEYPDPPLGGSPTNITFPVSNPCAVKATTLSSPTWANTLNAAKDNWLALDHESAYTYTNINQLSTYSFQYGSRNEPFINLTVPVQITGMVHSHPTGIVDMNNNPVRMSPTPTPEDFAAIGTLFNTGKLAIPSTFTSTVITGLGSLYMISISDPNLFKTWMTTNFARDSDGVTLFEKNFTSLGNALLAGGGYSDRDAHETALLYYLQNSGIRMIRGDINNLYSSANWLPLNYNSSWYRTQATPCP